MEQRKKALLSQIIRQYIKTASPIGSKFLETRSGLGVSSATIRNEMRSLEEEGYIMQPHTSAGRIPTEQGYQFFLENSFKEGKLEAKVKSDLEKLLKDLKKDNLELRIKEVAKKTADYSRNTVLVAFSDNNLYYTGLSNLFSQPEFNDQSVIYNLSLIIDHLDQVMARLFGEVEATVVRLGSNNPFGQQCSVLLSPWHLNKEKGVMGILGPMRMDYERNLSLLNFITEKIK
ncbi:MAG: hypothetical protein COU22_03650 [Candidatus Komeilibacteria bacterium CG10_big_fil_rev_8_21_14_0_10_41_13]|uniref:Heat-inducible transcription repressor HrcA C-terminal domain-containing protein n=1 Tax=Candidatus Komeilibacteria bacterium CG10_big_fil_rev_8_21_14_0_10_41_13 TaxID=1974476 RepID=A0A2M6WBV5_9BACT|nr:MAG: hypothetical protein COU22_03650 [Candidatus Komeilibacteria bacterium CG10_big_fil_rev_8_21_14_0_10_41_13]